MKTSTKPITILMADDDADDRLLIQESFNEAHLSNDLFFVEDGQELMDYLTRKGKYENGDSAPVPDLVLLDLNMPRMDGREALKEIKNNPELRKIPVVVLTTSSAEEDILRTYDLGVAGFITKPVTFDGLVAQIKIFGDYWFEVVKLPK